MTKDSTFYHWGLLTSGLVSAELALQVLMIGPAYEQTVIKSEKAAAALRFVSAEVLLPEEIAQYRAFVSQEEALFQEQFGKLVDGGS